MLFFVVLLFVSLLGSGVQGQGCSMTLTGALNIKEEPLILSWLQKKWSFAYPDVVGSNAALQLRDNQELILICSGIKQRKLNKHKISGEPSAILKCKQGKLTVKASPTHQDCVMSDAATAKRCTACEFTVLSRIETFNTNFPCGKGINTGSIVEMGFQVSNQWVPLISSCYNKARCVNFYTVHEIQKAANKGLKSGHTAFSSAPNLYPEIFDPIRNQRREFNPADKYTKLAVKDTFNKLLPNTGQNYFKNGDYISTGHLAPHADFIYTTEKGATYYFVNSAPQWQKFNVGNWLTVERQVRNLAEQLGRTLKVWTGTYGIQKLENKEMYLDPDNKLLPIPEVFWKLIYDPYQRKCTVAIGINNPHISTAPTPLCGDPNTSPSNTGWPSLHELNKGFGYYCTYSDFKTRVVDYGLNLDTECSNGLLKIPPLV